jgi:hypothetical protein
MMSLFLVNTIPTGKGGVMFINIDAWKAFTIKNNVLYIGICSLKITVIYIYISLDVIGITELIEALGCEYNLICNVQLNMQQEITNLGSNKLKEKEEVYICTPVKEVILLLLCGSCYLNSDTNLSKDLKGLMCRVPSLSGVEELGEAICPTP